MATTLGPASIPLLTPEATFQAEGDDLTLDTETMSLTFHGDSARVLAAIRDRLDGSASIAELAGATGFSPAALAAVLAPLAEDGLLVDVLVALTATSAEEFLPVYKRICSSWAREMMQVPFWRTLLEGRASRELVLGWGIEFYHYVASANEHMAAAVAHCRTDNLARQWLAQHYVEEHDHAAIFLDGLVACGFDADQIRRSPPLASTRALINYLIELGTTDSLAYAGAYGVIHHGEHVDPSSGDSEPRLYETLARQYGYAAGLFEAIGKHASVDGDLGHDKLVIERMIERPGRMSPDAARRILAGARGLTEHFILYFEGIHDAYADSACLLPRRVVDAQLLLGSPT